jgi:cellulose synthase/poly-beta-1,6-N-acetylglucosamine synthase-like glycosyltransferase
VPLPAVTVAIVVKDRRLLMERCLDAVLAQSVDGGFEVVVGANGTTDGTLELLEGRAAASAVPMTVLRDGGTLGRIRNVAVEAAAAPVIAFTDSDCVPAAGWLAALTAPLRGGDERLAVVQGRTLAEPGHRGRWSATQELTAFTHLYEACNLAYRTDALRGAGGFDEGVGFFGEDTAAGWAVRRAGWRASFEPTAVVHHAVTHPGLGWHLRRGWGYANWNALVRRFPELRHELLWHRWFLRPASAAFAAAIVGLIGGLWRPPLLALALPYLWHRRPRGRHRSDLIDTAGAVAFDASVFGGLVRGSLRERTLVL